MTKDRWQEVLTVARKLLVYSEDDGLFRQRIDSQKYKKGSIRGTLIRGYVHFGIGQTHVYAHRLAWAFVYGEWPKGDIDHINGIRNDNRIANLRCVTRSQNMENVDRARSSSKSGMLGVYRCSSTGRWRAEIGVNGKRIKLGRFDSASNAYQAYLNAKKEMHKFSSRVIE